MKMGMMDRIPKRVGTSASHRERMDADEYPRKQNNKVIPTTM